MSPAGETGESPQGDARTPAGAIRALREEHHRFVHSVSHYLKAPLSALLGFAALLEEEIGPQTADIRHYVCRIAENAKLMERMIDELVYLSRLEREDGPPCDLAETVHAAMKRLEDVDPQSSSRVSVQPGVPAFPLPRSHAVQLMSRLLSNALRFSREHVPVLVGYRNGEFLVSDQGEGMSPEVMRKAFDMFYTTAGKDARRSGAGLAVARAVARLYGGDLRIESKPGGPTTVFIRIGSPA